MARQYLGCRCGGSRDAWRVLDRECNWSAFNGYRRTQSAYSKIVCCAYLGGCGIPWRTKAAYVTDLPDIDRDRYIREG